MPSGESAGLILRTTFTTLGHLINTYEERCRSLPAVVGEWEELGFDGRYDFTMSWDSQIRDLSDSAGQYVRGELPADEGEEYLALLAETLGALPLAAKLGLHGPELPPGHPPVTPTMVSRRETGEEPPMDRADDRGTALQADERDFPTVQRPVSPTKGDLDRWAGMSSTDRFQDAAYQRWAQSFRSRESLSAAGRAGYNATLSRYGREYLHDRLADSRRAQDPPRSLTERKVMHLLAELGERQDRTEYGESSGTYLREHKLAPSRHADFAWPDRGKAIEAWGGVHTAKYFVERETVREANRRQVERAQQAGWEVMILTDEDMQAEKWDETRERVRRFLA